MPTNRNASTGFLCEPSIGSANTKEKRFHVDPSQSRIPSSLSIRSKVG
jgi:hypothetical protein